MMAQIKPESITQNIRMQVSKHFDRVRRQLDEVECSVLDQIRKSTNLADYFKIVE
jgi:hypothetical protein